MFVNLNLVDNTSLYLAAFENAQVQTILFKKRA